MTIGDWVQERSALVPATLRAGISEALGSTASRPAAEAADALLDAAERRLAEFLPRGATARDGAVPLLTIDALITFALEAASECPEALAARAREAMLRLSHLAGACP
ncbi:MAG TPA: hypothetical protein VK922_01835 [Gemmatimonadaceae bacterium]|nr:hypothetical protein [Gemmatimonadaceae bacterium]